MADELENAKESGEKGDKSAGESSMASSAAAGERLSQESFAPREESRQLSGSDIGGEQSVQTARLSREVSADLTNQNFAKTEQQVSRSVSQSLPDLRLDSNKTAQRSIERSVNSNIATSVEKGSKILGEMTISNNNSQSTDQTVKTLDAYKSTDNSLAKLATNDSSVADIQNAERSSSFNNAVTSSKDNLAQAARKSDFQNAFSDKRISDSFISPDAIQKSSSLKDLAAPAAKLDLASFNTDNQVAKSFADKSVFENKQLLTEASLKSDAKLASTDFSKMEPSANRYEAMLRVDGQTAMANQSKMTDLQRFQNESLRADKALGEFKPETKMDKSLAAEKLGASNESSRNIDQTKPIDGLRNESTKPASEALRSVDSRTQEQTRAAETRPEISNIRSDARQTESTKAPEQTARVADTRADETVKKPAAAVEPAALTKSETAKFETAKLEAMKPEAPKAEPVKVEAAKPEAAKQESKESAKQESKEGAKTEPAAQQSQRADRHEDHIPATTIAAAAAAALTAAREADKANAGTRPADQQIKFDSTGNALNRATINGINVADTGIQAIKASTADKAATPALGRDILPSENKNSAFTAEKAANTNAQDLTGRSTRIDGNIQQISKLADQLTSNAKGEPSGSSLRGEISANARGSADRTEAVTGKDAGARPDTLAINGRTESSVKGSGDPRCIQFDGSIKASTGDATRNEKDLELQGSDAADGDSEEGDNKLKVKRYTANGNKLYLTGVEISLAALLTMAGAARLREKSDDKQEASQSDEEKDKDAQVFIRRTYMVQEGDTLLSIAEDIYNNRLAAWLIADMNAANTKEAWIDGRRVVELQARQILELPEAEELLQFTAKQRRDFDPERLVTVVTQSVVDRELLQAFLGTVSGEANSDATGVKGTVRATAALPAKQQLPELTIEGMDADEKRFPPTGLGAVITDLATMIKQSLKRPARDLGGAVS